MVNAVLRIAKYNVSIGEILYSDIDMTVGFEIFAILWQSRQRPMEMWVSCQLIVGTTSCIDWLIGEWIFLRLGFLDESFPNERIFIRRF